LQIKKNIIFATIILGFILGLVLLIDQVFSGSLILPQVFSIGQLSVHYYGLTMALAVGAGFYLAIKRAEDFGITKTWAEDFLFWIIVGGFIGARFYHVLSSFEYYLQNPVDIFKVWNGGLSIYGALLGGLFVIWFFADKILHLKSNILNLLDWLTPSLLLGQIIGRFGNLFNYEAYGYPTNLPWKMFVPEQFRPEVFVTASYFHPFFLYEVLGNVLILGLLLYYGARETGKARIFSKAGALFFSYILLYNSLRFCLEFFRIDSTFIGVLRLNAVTSLALVLLSAGGLLALNYKCSKDIN
jgi:phosphatidylglycerol:prolipoprotein diacylglycerol transferase